MRMLIVRFINKTSSGSAIAEFLIFTLPFFAAFLILITLVQYKAVAISESNNLARQAVRAFVTSPSEQLALPRANQVLDIYRSKLSQQALVARPIKLSITCQNYPCFSPGNRVTATVTVGNDQKSFATEFVDLWR
jgi:hypothetical protein